MADTATGPTVERDAEVAVAPEQGGPVDEEMPVEELLVEEVSIDGMCGVY